MLGLAPPHATCLLLADAMLLTSAMPIPSACLLHPSHELAPTLAQRASPSLISIPIHLTHQPDLLVYLLGRWTWPATCCRTTCVSQPSDLIYALASLVSASDGLCPLRATCPRPHSPTPARPLISGCTTANRVYGGAEEFRHQSRRAVARCRTAARPASRPSRACTRRVCVPKS